MILNVGGGPTPDKPAVTLSIPDPNHINSFMNIRVADTSLLQVLEKSRSRVHHGANTQVRRDSCYIRHPDGYIIEVGQSTALKHG